MKNYLQRNLYLFNCIDDKDKDSVIDSMLKTLVFNSIDGDKKDYEQTRRVIRYIRRHNSYADTYLTDLLKDHLRSNYDAIIKRTFGSI